MVWSELDAGEPAIIAGEEGQVRRGGEALARSKTHKKRVEKRETGEAELREGTATCRRARKWLMTGGGCGGLARACGGV